MPIALSPRRLAAAFLVVAVTGAAAAQAASAPAAPRAAEGTATSGITLVDLTVAGRTISVGSLSLTSGVSAATAGVKALTVDGKGYGEKSVTVGTASSPALDSTVALPSTVSRLVTVTAPAASISAGSGFARAGTQSLGSVRVLGLPVALDGSASASSVVEGTRAASEKTLVVRNLSLPSITGLLGALGLDLTKLPADTLLTLVQKLGLTTTTITDAKKALDAAIAPLQPQIDAAQQKVADAKAAVDTATQQVTSTTTALGTATTALDSATSQLQAALGGAHLMRANALIDPIALPTLVPVPTAVPTVVPTAVPSVLPTALPTALPTSLPTSLPTALPSVLPSTLPLPTLPAVIPVSTQPLVGTYNTAKAAYDDALAKVNAATGALNLANGVLNTVSTTLNTLLSTVQTQAAALVHAIVDVLGQTPLVSVDSFTVRTEATATSAAKGDQTARVVSGELQGVHVLGTDVLQKTLNSDRVDLGLLTSGPIADVNAELASLTGTLSGVLSKVPGLPTLNVPAPRIELLASTMSSGADGDFGVARNAVQALRLTLPALTIPSAVQLPGGLGINALGDLVSQPLSIGIGTMSDAARFRPAVGSNTGVVPPSAVAPTGSTPTGSTPTGSTPSGSTPTGTTPDSSVPSGSTPNSVPTASGVPELPRTGLPAGLAIFAVGLVGAGLVLRRTAAL